jgi:hypothetical protein
MELSQKVIATNWYHFLKVLVKSGRYQWATNDEDGKTCIVSTLFIDGDLHCFVPDPDGMNPEKFTMETARSHLDKIAADLASLERFTKQIAVVSASIFLLLVCIFNAENYMHNIIFSAAFSSLVYFFRRKIFGWIISVIFLMLKGPFGFAKS